jgi:crossover junction endodeoxyribonuclease RusA
MECRKMNEPFFTGRLPIPPGINESHRPGGKNGRTVHTKVAKAFKQNAGWMLKSATVDWQMVGAIQEAKKKHKQIPLECNIIYFFEHMWLRDEDGGIKITQDVVFQYLELNDNLVVDLHVKKRMDKADPRTEVSLFLVQE